MDFHLKQVVWAKVKGYPWWPAYINKLPSESQENFKVIFFAEDTYAMLQPKFVQKFSDNYAEHSKTKAKKFLKALQLANNSANSIPCPVNNNKSIASSKKKGNKKQSQQQHNSQQEQILQQSSLKNQQQQSSINNEQGLEALLEIQTQQIDRKKVQKIQNQLAQIIGNIQTNRKQWKYSKYFQNFQQKYELNCEQLLHSNLTRKIRFIIQTLKTGKIDQKDIERLQQLSTNWKKKIIDYLTDTTYYDQHLKAIDKSKHNKVQVQNQLIKLLKKRYNGQIKKQFITILATQIGVEVSKNLKFKTKQLLTQIKDGEYDPIIKSTNSKAATQRFADQLINKYRE